MSAAGRPRVIAIDGPAGAGKTTAARELARELGMTLLDTGAIYRTLALVAHRRGISWDDETALAALAEDFPLEFRAPAEDGGAQRVFFDGGEVTTDIRTPLISEGASKVSVHPKVRQALLHIQRAIPARSEAGCVAEGRDMGTVVFPDAPYKFFVTASHDARARRRHLELQARGPQDGGPLPSLASVAEEMRTRDQRDSQRDVAPLKAADDAVLVDTTEMDADAVLALLLDQVDASTFHP
jgi:cytidylate kinase